MKRMNGYFIATIGYMAVLAVMSVLPLTSPEEAPSLWKQIAHNFLHVPAYAILTHLYVRCFGRRTLKVLMRAAFMSLGYGLFMEYLQSLTPFRYPSFLDVGLNAAGTGIVVFLYWRHRESGA